MNSFDAEISAALTALERDVRERVSQWLKDLDDAFAPLPAHHGIQLQPVDFICRVPSAHFKDQAIVVSVPEWQLQRQPVEVTVETYAASAASDSALAREAGELAWTPLATGCVPETVDTTVAVDVPRLQFSPNELAWRVPSLVMNLARLRLDLPACPHGTRIVDAAALRALQLELTCEARAAQARIASAVASLFRKALRELLNLRATTLGRIDAVARASAQGAAAGGDPAQRAHLNDAREGAIATFAHEAEALERQAVQLVADTVEGLTLRVVDVGDDPHPRVPVVALRQRIFGPLRLQVRSADTRAVPHGDGVPGATRRTQGPAPFDPDTPDL